MPSKTKIFDPYDFSKKVIDGVPVYYKNFPTSPCVHINVCFDVGVLNDPTEQHGISHFLEHMIFDGSPKLPNKKTIEKWKKINTLGSWNAWTFFTNTNYHLRCLPEKFETVLDGMADMIFNPILREEDVEHERKVITQEAWGRYKNEKYLAYSREYLENLYKGTLREKISSPLGWPDTIAKISRENIYSWHKKNYGKGKFFIVISGAVDESDLKKIEKFIAQAPKLKPEKTNFGKLNKPKKLFVTKIGEEIGDPKEQAEVTFCRIEKLRESKSEEVQNMASSLLYDILFERLRTERALCYGVGVNSYIQRDSVMWNVGLELKSENVEVAKKEFWKTLNDIVSGKEKARFETLKQVRIDRLKSMEEITADSTENVLADLWKFGKITSKKTMLAEREKVTYKDVVSCLKNAFKKDWTVTEVILPSKK